MTIKPYIVIPNLIKQPTWGGFYILKYKDIKNKFLDNEKIGQSYELYESSNLSIKDTTSIDPSFEISDPENPENVQTFYRKDQIFSINHLININPTQVLGEKYAKQMGNKVKTLIKLNQAKGNSYQIHVSKQSGKWLPKPESWFFLEKGLVSLGIKKEIDWNRYQQICLEIENLTKNLSQKIKRKELSLVEAKNKLTNFINDNNPAQFVNFLEINSNQAINLSDGGGIHHSWEENEQICPQGNIVYEVQENVYDNVSTIRSFDKGKLKTDGGIRDLQIEDYFQYINRSKEANDPKKYIVDLKIIKKTPTYLVQQVFTTLKYALQKIDLINQYSDKTTDSFHHLFVKEGKVVFESLNCKMTLTKGFGVFVPANTGSYLLRNLSSSAVILKTYL